MTAGGPDAASIRAAHGGALPGNTHAERFPPCTHLPASARVIVTNGGCGAVQHALRWGVPLVVSGTSEDGVEVNARVTWRGVGITLRRARPTPESIGAAVGRVLAEPRFRQAAPLVAAAIATRDALRSILDLAEELIPGPAGPTATPLPEGAR